MKMEHYSTIVFGTGILLRGLVLDIMNDAQKLGKLQGKVIMVQNTSGETYQLINSNEGNYEINIEGFHKRKSIQNKKPINGLIGEAININIEGLKYLKEIFSSEDLSLVISNTTEIGLN